MPSVPSSTSDLFASRPVRTMLSALERNALSHSLIISGSISEEVELIGEHLAQTVLDGGAPEPRPLDHHPDFLSIRPTKKMRQISADDTRELIRKISHSPNYGSRKVAIIYDAERFHSSSANIFLKTLEEPPSNTTIILLTTHPQYLLATIRSRCLHFRLPSTRQGEKFAPEVTEWLEDYSHWLTALSGNLSAKREICDQVMQLYGLVARFSPLLKTAVASAWKEQKTQLPENLTGEEEEALAVGIRLELRDQVFAALESRLRQYALTQIGDPTRIRPFTRSVDELERAAGLLRVNLNEAAALETFLLETLRAWGRRQ